MIKSRRLRWAGHVARLEEGRNALKILTGKPTGKRPLGRPRRRWEDNTGMDLEETGVNAGNWVDSAQDRDYWRSLVNAALNLWVPLVMELVSSLVKSTTNAKDSFSYLYNRTVNSGPRKHKVITVIVSKQG